MSKKTNCNKMLVHQLSSVLPDDRPITAISVVEDIDKCPPNFTVVCYKIIFIFFIIFYLMFIKIFLNYFIINYY